MSAFGFEGHHILRTLITTVPTWRAWLASSLAATWVIQQGRLHSPGNLHIITWPRHLHQVNYSSRKSSFSLWVLLCFLYVTWFYLLKRFGELKLLRPVKLSGKCQDVGCCIYLGWLCQYTLRKGTDGDLDGSFDSIHSIFKSREWGKMKEQLHSGRKDRDVSARTWAPPSLILPPRRSFFKPGTPPWGTHWEG